MMRLSGLIAALLAVAPSAFAAAPRVVADIAPIHSLVARVMVGVGEPALLVRPGASPHGYALRPSEARALEAADLVIWVGPALTPQLVGSFDALAGGAQRIALSEAPAIKALPMREGAAFGADDHDHGAHDHGDHEGEHDGGAIDPHIWLDPANAIAVLGVVAEALAAVDPGDASTYAANAAAGAAEIAALSVEIAATLDPARGRRFLTLHDAFQYFEHAFGLTAVGAIAPADALRAGPARIETARDAAGDAGATCLLSTPGASRSLAATIADDGGLRLREADVIGGARPIGPGLYPALMRGLASTLVECLGE